MVKDAIALLDMGIEGFSVLKTLTKYFKHERFIYINDMKHKSYLDVTEVEVYEIVRKNVERLLKEKVKLIVVISDTIVDIASEVFSKLEIPVINIVDTLLNYLNTNYEQKNILLCAKSNIINANIYQKNIKYNRLYSIPSEELEELINGRMLKTSKSFYTIREEFKSVLRKDLDIVVTSSPYLITLKTEMNEFINVGEISDVGEIIVNQIKNDNVISMYEKGKQTVTVYSSIDKKDFIDATYWSDLKYKYFKIEEK
jgi:glutamate racemase